MTLKEYITSKELSPEQMAEKLDCSPGAVRKWLSHERTPRPDQMRRITLATGGKVTPNDFIQEDAA